MPGFILTAGTPILCAHGGQGQSAAPNPRVKLMGQPVLLQPIPVLIAGCSNPPPPVNIGPCVTANYLTGSMRVKVMGMPVLLQDSQAICVPTGTPLTIVPIQTRVRGM
ncbi:MAG: hypothetical protein SH847_25665 [Roseiflexaceae bacterium]|nr:hypothetical protein [Roseiflexaceae bacterium]